LPERPDELSQDDLEYKSPQTGIKQFREPVEVPQTVEAIKQSLLFLFFNYCDMNTKN
jgi:hypothetical protein